MTDGIASKMVPGRWEFVYFQQADLLPTDVSFLHYLTGELPEDFSDISDDRRGTFVLSRRLIGAVRI